MKCIIFNLPKKVDKCLAHILDEISIENYSWYINWDDIMFEDRKGDFSTENYLENKLKDKIIGGSDFKKVIEDYFYFPLFLDAKAFRNNSKISSIVSFDDYLNSNCEITFIIADSTYAEFCCKNEFIADQVINNCIKFDFSISNVIKDQNKIRELFNLH